MYTAFVLGFFLLVVLYNVYLAFLKRKKKTIQPMMVNVQVGLNFFMIVIGIIYLIFG